MKMLVTGGAGFIASTICDRFIEEGHDVIVVDSLISGKREYVPKEAVFYEKDILDSEFLNILRRERPQVINHHAAQIDVRKSIADPAFDAEVNIRGLIRLMESARNAGVQKVIFASSGGAIYADAQVSPTPESHPPCPKSPYGVSKLTGEYYLSFYEETYGIQTVSLRYGNVYGPRQDPHGEAGVVSIFIGKLLKGERPTIYGDGEQQRDYVFVQDVVEANIRALDGTSTGVFNIGTGVGTTVNTLLRNVQEVMGTHIEPVYADPRVGEAQKSVLDSTLAHEKLGWEPKHTLEEGLSKTVNFFAPKVIKTPQ